MQLGFALSPAGLLLPYHVGVLEALKQEGRLLRNSQIAGSSAGAIAATAYGCGLDSLQVLEATVQVSDECKKLGGARGRILPFLEEAFDAMIGEAEFQHFSMQQEQHQTIGIAYQQIFPYQKSHLQTSFQDRDDLLRAMRRSCMFPFFATNGPCLVERGDDDDDSSSWLPHCYVDGFFSVPRERFGCPLLENVDRTIGICHLPKDFIGVTAFEEEDCIAPSPDVDLGELIRIAVQPSSRQDLLKTFERGIQDGEKWCQEEAQREEVEDTVVDLRPARLQGRRSYAY